MGDQLAPFDFFVSETSHADVVIRTEAMSKAALVCAVMGPEKAREDLLSYLVGKKEDMDQVLLALSKSLAHFFPYIGGPDHCHLLIPLFEKLLNVEETMVRSAAATSVCSILARIIGHSRAKDYLELFKRLTTFEEGDETFYGRVSAAQISAALYLALSNAGDRVVLLEIYSNMLRDEMSIVRRSAICAFSQIFANAASEVRVNDLIPLLKLASAEDDPAAKVAAVDAYPDVVRVLKESDCIDVLVRQVVPLIKAATTDISWRIRYSISRCYVTFIQNIPQDVCKSELFPGAINLLMDNETDVRVLMCSSLAPFFYIVGGEPFLSEIVPIAQQLADDPVINVRKAVAEMVVDISAKCGEESSARLMNDLVIKIMEDEEPLVRLRIIRKIHILADEIPSLCTKLTPFLRTHFSDKNWRIRKELILSMPSVLRHMGQEFFTENFLTGFLLTLKDEVEEVRMAASAILPLLVSASTPLWIQEKIFPSVRALSAESYIKRISFLNSLKSLLEAELPDSFQTEVITLIITTANDAVPNVRVRTAQVLGFVSSKLDVDQNRMQVRPILNELASDKDKDVKYFATESLKICCV